jgi:hypothetical protein
MVLNAPPIHLDIDAGINNCSYVLIKLLDLGLIWLCDYRSYPRTLVMCIKEIAAARVHYAYRRIHALL